MSTQSVPNADVRMRGFAARTLVDTAIAWIDSQAQPLDAETALLDDLHGRVLAEDVIAAISVPPFDRAAMDGYALLGAETVGAGQYNPLRFQVRGQALPGQPYAGEVLPGTAVRIMTGAPMPTGGDAVLPAEYAQESNGYVEITTSIAPGKHVGHRGEDVAEGSMLLAAGRRLRAQDVGLLASVGIDRTAAVRQPRVRIIVTGNELVAPGESKTIHQIYDSNSSMLRGLLRRDGGKIGRAHV